jgi:hypothetical protein
MPSPQTQNEMGERYRETIKVFSSIHITDFNKEEEKDSDFDDETVRKQLQGFSKHHQPAVKCLT